MSRAFDSSTLSSVLASDPQAAYNDIVDALNINTSHLLEIEFLGKSHPLPPACNVLVDGTSIGVSKLKFVQAFVVARQLFFKSLEDFKEDNFQSIRDSTAVILLMDPEHITAANARKKMIQHLRGSGVDLQSVLRRELLVIDSFLTSRLHRHTKSPTLWGHRRWLLGISNSLKLPHDMQQDLETVVLVAAERHPRNYYAWLHLRWLLRGLRSTNHESESEAAINHSKVLLAVKDWCLRHAADTSGWSFLSYCLFSIEPPSARLEASSSICGEVLGLATSFKWTHESVWVFLRTLVASRNIQIDQRPSFFKTIGVVSACYPEDFKARNILKASYDWCVDYSE